MPRGNGNEATWWRCDVNAWVTSYTARTDTVHVQCIFVCTGNSAGSDSCSASVFIEGIVDSGLQNIGYQMLYGGERVVLERDFVVNKVDGARILSCGAYLTLPFGNGAGSSRATVGVGVGGIQYSPPNPPSNVGWSRVDDTKITGTWRGNWDNDNLKPWKQVILAIRRGENGAGWGVWSDQPGGTGATVLNWDATNYSYTGLKANSRYAFSVYARNQAGDSSHVDSGVIYTTPAAPKALTAEKTGASEVTLTADVANGFAWSVDFERSADNGATWDVVDTGRTVAAGKVVFTDTQAPAGAVRYRARAFRFIYDDGNGKQGNAGLFSDYTLSNTVTTVTPPLAPTITSPTHGQVIRAGNSLEVSWVPNHPDGSVQTAAQIGLLLPGMTAATTIDITGSQTTYTRTTSATGGGTVRVRTKGLHADWGAWSAPVDFNVQNAPTVVINKPSSTITASPFMIAWSAGSEAGISQQTVSITRDGVVVLSENVGSYATSLNVTAQSFLPANGDDLIITVLVRSGGGLQTFDNRRVHVAYTPPADPVVNVTTDGTYANTIIVAYGKATGGKPATDHVSVQRILQDGSTIMVGDNLGDNQAAVDPIPPLNVPVTYRATAWASSGAVATTDVTFTTEAEHPALNFGTDAGVNLLLGYDTTVSHSRTHATSEYHFARGEGAAAYPSSYELAQTDGTVDVTGVWPWDQDWWLKALACAAEYTYAWYREPSGFRAYVKADQSLDLDVAEEKEMHWSATLTVLSWEEPVR